jgi:hypothetical protein
MNENVPSKVKETPNSLRAGKPPNIVTARSRRYRGLASAPSFHDARDKLFQNLITRPSADLHTKRHLVEVMCQGVGQQETEFLISLVADRPSRLRLTISYIALVSIVSLSEPPVVSFFIIKTCKSLAFSRSLL